MPKRLCQILTNYTENIKIDKLSGAALRRKVNIGNKTVGDNFPCFIIAEIGINHNGSIDLAKKMIDEAVMAGCDAVKFQKRTVTKVYTPEELDTYRPNYYGSTNRDLKLGLELSYEDYCEIDKYCKLKKIMWFASCWDEDSVDFIEQFDVPCHKVASALLTDDEFLYKVKSTGKPILLSTGMSTMEEIRHAVKLLDEDNLIIYHCTSTYPTEHNEINLKVIEEFRKEFNCPIGYSGHEKGLLPSILSVELGANSVERHITIDRTLWGSDQAASLEPEGLRRMVRDIKEVKRILGDGIKVVYDSEIPFKKKLRKNHKVSI